MGAVLCPVALSFNPEQALIRHAARAHTIFNDLFDDPGRTATLVCTSNAWRSHSLEMLARVHMRDTLIRVDLDPAFHTALWDRDYIIVGIAWADHPAGVELSVVLSSANAAALSACMEHPFRDLIFSYILQTLI